MRVASRSRRRYERSKDAGSKITKIAQGVVDGDSHFYIMLEGSDDIFDVSVVDFIDIIKYNVGDTVTVEYKEDERANSVLSLNGEEPALSEE